MVDFTDLVNNSNSRPRHTQVMASVMPSEFQPQDIWGGIGSGNLDFPGVPSWLTGSPVRPTGGTGADSPLSGPSGGTGGGGIPFGQEPHDPFGNMPGPGPGHSPAWYDMPGAWTPHPPQPQVPIDPSTVIPLKQQNPVELYGKPLPGTRWTWDGRWDETPMPPQHTRLRSPQAEEPDITQLVGQVAQQQRSAHGRSARRSMPRHGKA